MNIWEINNISNIHEEDFEDSKVYWMDDFYKYPDLVFEYITRESPPLWKWGDDWDGIEHSKNTKHFEDRRWDGINAEGIHVPNNALSKIFNQTTKTTNEVVTNHTRFFTDSESIKYNDYKNNWWWPHTDSGYNALVYLNKSEDGTSFGTNLYRLCDGFWEGRGGHEHANPWIRKDTGDCERIAAFKSKYNRLVAFDGYRYQHGMSVDDDRWFYETRVNQVMFFDDPEDLKKNQESEQ